MTVKIPKRGTEAYRWWHQGAKDEANAIVEGMTDDGRQVYDFVRVVAQQGGSADWITEYTAAVFTCTWPLRKRLRLAWDIVRKK